MNPEHRAPTMLPARILWPHVATKARRKWIMAALTLMTRDELASLGVDRSFDAHADDYSGATYPAWNDLPIPLRERILQFTFGEDSKLSIKR